MRCSPRPAQSILWTTLLMGIMGLMVTPGCGRRPEVMVVERAVQVCASGPTLDGIDVSYWQGSIDWDQVAADGISFAFIRVSDGTGTHDSRFQYNWAEAKRVGIVRGAYQFFRPSQDPIAQADLLISQIGGALEPGDLPPVIDVEVSGGLSRATVAARVRQWLDRVESVLGVTPIIYTSPGLWGSYVNSSAFGGYPLWVAHYYVSCPSMPTGWTDWDFHQYTDSGQVAGIASNSVDRNVFNGTLADLQAMTWGGGPAAVCGDGLCNGGEDHASCPVDCPTCEPIPATGRILDDDDLCLTLGGDMQYWRDENDGYGGRLWWTYSVSTQAYNDAVWELTFEQAGWYRIEAYTDATWAQSTQARYQVTHGGTTDVAEVDQTAHDGWTTVGVFQFAEGGGQRVRLADLTGESGRRLVVDALRVLPTSAPTESPDDCRSIPAQGAVLEENDECVDLEGDPQYWRTEAAGSGGELLWTYTVSSQAYNYVVWELTFEQAGWYRIEAYTDATWAQSTQARYQVTHGGTTDVAEVDQTAHDGWTTVGVFQFAEGGGQRVRLADLTGESGRRLVVDALRVLPTSAPTESPDDCRSIPAQGAVLEENDECVDLEGDPQYWRTEAAGSGGELVWTYTVSSQTYNYVVWNLSFEQAGRYQLEVYTPAPWGESEQARYQVHAMGTTHQVVIDQSAQSGWASLGEFHFEGGGDQWLRLEDLTGEPGWTRTRLVVDALRITRVDTGYGGVEDPTDVENPSDPADEPAGNGAAPGPYTTMGCNTAGPADRNGHAPVRDAGAMLCVLLPLLLVWRRRHHRR